MIDLMREKTYDVCDVIFAMKIEDNKEWPIS